MMAQGIGKEYSNHFAAMSADSSRSTTWHCDGRGAQNGFTGPPFNNGKDCRE
jgi:hypothetical protein